VAALRLRGSRPGRNGIREEEALAIAKRWPAGGVIEMRPIAE
jgi:hypothetical protein